MKIVDYLQMHPYIIAKFMVNEKIIQDRNGNYVKGYAFNNLKGEIYYFSECKKEVIEKAIEFLKTELIML